VLQANACSTLIMHFKNLDNARNYFEAFAAASALGDFLTKKMLSKRATT
jgi:hypothetical protein